jgi:hypothetical protein
MAGAAAQQGYRPWQMSIAGLLPTGAWGRHTGSFPEAGFCQNGLAFALHKAYYDRWDWLGWYLGGELYSWSVRTDRLLPSLLPSGISWSPDYRLRNLTPQGLTGEIGLTVLYTRRKWIVHLPVGMRITGLSFGEYTDIPLTDGSRLSILPRRNTFLGLYVGASVGLYTKEGPEEGGLLGIGVPFFWGRSSIYTVTRTFPDGGRISEVAPFYLPPSHVAFRLSFLLRL